MWLLSTNISSFPCFLLPGLNRSVCCSSSLFKASLSTLSPVNGDNRIILFPFCVLWRNQLSPQGVFFCVSMKWWNCMTPPLPPVMLQSRLCRTMCFVWARISAWFVASLNTFKQLELSAYRNFSLEMTQLCFSAFKFKVFFLL